VHCVVAVAAQTFRQRRRQRAIDQEPHDLVRGSARSRTASAAN
jgi:hypothetical protein